MNTLSVTAVALVAFVLAIAYAALYVAQTVGAGIAQAIRLP